MSTEEALKIDCFLVERRNGDDRQSWWYETEETARNALEQLPDATLTPCKIVPHELWLGIIDWCRLIAKDFLGADEFGYQTYWQRSRLQKLNDLLTRRKAT